MREVYTKFRAKMEAAGWWPQGWVARGACYALSFALALLVIEGVLKPFAPAVSNSLSGWVKFLVLVAIFLFFAVAFRWLKRKLLWRLRNRLIVTYVFVGVIPAVLLISMTLITLYVTAGQFALFMVTSEINSHLHRMEAADAVVGNELAARLEHGEPPTAESFAGLRQRDALWRRRRISAWYGDKLLPLGDEAVSFPSFAKNSFSEITRDHNGLYLRAVTMIPTGSKTLTVVTSEPFDKEFVGKIAADMGEVTLSEWAIRESKKQFSATEPHPVFTVGAVPPAAGSVDREVAFLAPIQVLDWGTGERFPSATVKVRTRPSVLYNHLFAAWGESIQVWGDALVVILIFLAVIVLIALIIGTRMTRTVTAVVAQLYDATKHIDRGDFSHKVPVKSKDQLALLSMSFNTMTASIEKLILEQKEKQRLEGELAIAQEVQEQLFPREVTQLESLEVHGFCRPARTVSGDYYDFLAASSHKMILAAGDISGKGISAALLMATIHSAVRAYSVESLPQIREPLAVGAAAGQGRMTSAWPEGIDLSPSALLGLLNHQLYESTPPEKYATLFLGIYDGRSHRLTYSNGGHLPPILIGVDGSLRRLEAGGTVVGLIDNVTYDEDCVDMHPGEIFLAYSDGVTEPENEFGEFGESRLIELVNENRHLPLVQITQAVTAAVDDWIGDKEQPDDITLVLARAR
jgi:phosphoserine phosphatase RsbU/P